MGRFLILIVVLAAIVFAVGLYQGWFHLSSENAKDTSAVTLTVDKAKLREDEKRAKEKVEAVRQDVRDKVAPATQPAPAAKP
jgi:flagellar basal body-associated protein FliL